MNAIVEQLRKLADAHEAAANLPTPPASDLKEAVQQLQQQGIPKGKIQLQVEWTDKSAPKLSVWIFEDGSYSTFAQGPTVRAATASALAKARSRAMNDAEAEKPVEQALEEALPDGVNGLQFDAAAPLEVL